MQTKIKPNFSTIDINSNNQQGRTLFGINNNNYNYINPEKNTVIVQSQNIQFSETKNNNNRNSIHNNNIAIEKIDNKINVNEKVISSPFQVYTTHQKGKKGNNINVNSNQSLSTGKRILFDLSKEKDKKNNLNNKNININFQNKFYNIKGKEAELLQSLVINLQNNIPEYDKRFVNEEDIKKMKNKSYGKNNNIK